jgi:hypothetical protein
VCFNHEIFSADITGDSVAGFFGIYCNLYEGKVIRLFICYDRFSLTEFPPIAQAVAKFDEHILILVKMSSHMPSGSWASSNTSSEPHWNRSR